MSEHTPTDWSLEYRPGGPLKGVEAEIAVMQDCEPYALSEVFIKPTAFSASFDPRYEKSHAVMNHANRLTQCAAAFEDPAGRKIATEDIAPGAVFQLRDALEDLTNRIAQDIAPTATPQMLDSIPSISEARALLSSLKIQEPDS